jgi:hypothetical protein
LVHGTIGWAFQSLWRPDGIGVDTARTAQVRIPTETRALDFVKIHRSRQREDGTQLTVRRDSDETSNNRSVNIMLQTTFKNDQLLIHSARRETELCRISVELEGPDYKTSEPQICIYPPQHKILQTLIILRRPLSPLSRLPMLSTYVAHISRAPEPLAQDVSHVSPSSSRASDTQSEPYSPVQAIFHDS